MCLINFTNFLPPNLYNIGEKNLEAWEKNSAKFLIEFFQRKNSGTIPTIKSLNQQRRSIMLDSIPLLGNKIQYFWAWTYFLIVSSVFVVLKFGHFWKVKNLKQSATFCSTLLNKGQLILKLPFGVIIWTKKPTKNLTNSCPRPLTRLFQVF